MSWIDLVLFPIITGLVLLGGQFVIQPRIAAREHFNKAKWDAKRGVYAKAIKLVNQKFASIGTWEGPDVPPSIRSMPVGEPPSREELNQCYAELALYSSRSILRAFLGCFGTPPGPIKPEHRMELIRLMRADLGLGQTDIRSEDVWFFVKS